MSFALDTAEIIERLKDIKKTVGPRAKEEIQELIDDLRWPWARRSTPPSACSRWASR